MDRAWNYHGAALRPRYRPHAREAASGSERSAEAAIRVSRTEPHTHTKDVCVFNE